MDFTNRYFTKKNANFMAKIKPEENELREQYAADPMRLNRERQALYKRHGYKMGGFCLFTLINLVVTLAVFMSVFQSLRAVSTHNVDLTVQNLQGIYKIHETELLDETIDEAVFRTQVNDTYRDHAVGFLWVKNIWKQDVPWTKSGLSWNEYARRAKVITDEELKASGHETVKAFLTAQGFQDTPEGLTAYVKATYGFDTQEEYIRFQYDSINDALDKKHKRGWNGLLFLVIFAGVSSWGTAYITMKMNKTQQKNAPPKEEKAGYSMRDIKNKLDPKVPQIDPAMVGKVMMFVLPAIMIFFTMSQTAALAIYIITNSIISTLITLGTNWPVDKLLDWQDKRKKNKGPDIIDPDVINPHAKYFKSKRK
jgi:membrane protein insertase Oxa1/YidC/SpoIIIJ